MANDKKNLKTMADILFMPMLFYVLTRWGDMGSLSGKILWVALLMFVYNEMMSVRESYAVYQVSIYILDLFSLFIYVLALDALSDANAYIGYDPTFWLAISGLWLNYALWDLFMSKLVKKPDSFKYKTWSSCMFCFSITTFFCYLLISYTSSKLTIPLYKNIYYVSLLIALSMILWALYMWISERHKWFSSLRVKDNSED